MSTLDNALQALLSMAHKELLWTNAKPTSSFAAQTINLSLSKYKRIKIVIAYGTKSNYKYVYELVVGSESEMTAMYDTVKAVSGIGVRGRECNIMTTGIEFMNCTYKKSNYDESVVDNSYFIPIEIYGIKE